MDAPDIHPELDAQLDAIDDFDAAETSGMFRIDTLSKANWAVHRVGVHRDRMVEAEKFVADEIKRLTDWLDDERQQSDASCRFLEGALRRYHEAELARDPKRKTVKLPAGRLEATDPPKTGLWSWDDEAALLAWAEANDRRDLIRYPEPPAPKVEKAAAKKLLERRGPVVVDPTTGEVVPGITVADGETTYRVKPHEGDDR